MRLVITNGSSGVHAIQGILGDDSTVLAWEDVLHDGPVPFRPSLKEQSEVRIGFLSSWADDMGSLTPDAVRERFEQRDECLNRSGNFDEIVLWFDHDLYDQLQLIQVGWALERLAESIVTPASHIITYVHYADYLNAEQASKMKTAFDKRLVLEEQSLSYLSSRWLDFTSPVPLRLSEALKCHSNQFAFVSPALHRLCQEYPSVDRRITRNEYQILCALDGIPSMQPGKLFSTCQGMEQVAYLGDWSFWQVLSRMTSATDPLVTVAGRSAFVFPREPFPDPKFSQQNLSVSDLGREILLGSAVWSRPEYWVGGVRIAEDADWRWNEAEKKFGNHTVQ